MIENSDQLSTAAQDEIMCAIQRDDDDCAHNFVPLFEVVERIVREAIEEVLTGALHPEFGTEWREPDGIIWQAVRQAKAEAWDETVKTLAHAGLINYSVLSYGGHPMNPYK